jgi:putative spermidine/putrescine transport system permease protein
MTDATAGNISQDAANARREDAAATGPMLAADGRPLKVSLNRALRRQKLRALALIAPLLLFILITFVAPIFDMLFRSVENQIVSETLPRTVIALEDWDAEDCPAKTPSPALAYDFMEAAERRNHTRLGSRLNYETTGLSSTFRRSGRGIDDVGETYADQFIDLNEAWEDPATWVALMAASRLDRGPRRRPHGPTRVGGRARTDVPPRPRHRRRCCPRRPTPTAPSPAPSRRRTKTARTEEEPWNTVYLALYRDLSRAARMSPPMTGPRAGLLTEAAAAVPGSRPSICARLREMDEAGSKCRSGKRSRPSPTPTRPAISSPRSICN